VERLIEEYLSQLSKVRDHKTVRRKEHLLKHLQAWADFPVPFDQSNVFSFYDYLKQKGLKDSTIYEILRESKLFYEYLREKGYDVLWSETAWKRLLRSKKSTTASKKYYSDEELELILSFIRGEKAPPKPPIYYLLVVFLVSSGLRISEALSVKKRDFEVKKLLTESGEEREVWFVNVCGKFGKERRAFIYFFNPFWKKMVEEKLKRLKPDDLLFTYSVRYPKTVKTFKMKPSTAKWFFWNLEKEIKSAGYNLEVNAHRFRNTYVTKLATLGFPVNLIADWVGHSKISTTLNVYMQAEKEKQLSVILSKL